MNQKMTKLMQENQKLLKELEQARTGVKSDRKQEKPVLFGANDFE